MISQPNFILADVAHVNWQHLDSDLASRSTILGSSGWEPLAVPSSIPPQTPAATAAVKPDPTQNTIQIPGFQSQKIMDVIRERFTKNDITQFHYDPYKLHCKKPNSETSHRLYGQAYESPRMNKAHQAVEKTELNRPCKLPRCSALLMIFSDTLQLGIFGPAKAWPIRVSFWEQVQIRALQANLGRSL